MIDYKNIKGPYKSGINAFINAVINKETAEMGEIIFSKKDKELRNISVQTEEIKKERKLEAKKNLRWIVKYKNKIKHFIQGKYNALNTLRSYYSVIALVLEAYGKDGTKYRLAAKKIANEIKRIEEKNELDEGEKKNWVSHEECEYVLKKIKNYDDLRKHMRYIAVMLYTMQPPIRSQYCDMIIVNKYLKKENVLNYMVYDKKNIYDSYIVINDDKVSRSKNHKENKKILLCKEIIDELKKSFELFPRKYVLVDEDNKPMGRTKMIYTFESAFKILGKKPSIDVFRSSYVTYKFDTKDENGTKMNIIQKKKLAADMRTSIEMLELAYYKAIVDVDINKVLAEADIINDNEKIKKHNNNKEYYKAHAETVKVRVKKNRKPRTDEQKIAQALAARERRAKKKAENK